MTAKIIDFGLALVLMPHEKCSQAYGTLAYCSPEIILNVPHTKTTDVWSFGIVLHVMLTLRLPFLAHHKRITSRNIVSQKLNYEDEMWAHVSKDATDLVDRMLDKSSDTRITVAQMLAHRWL
jgi:serine/threonine protein kinase